MGNSVHMHIENISTYHPHVQVTQEQYEAAAARHPDVADRVRTTIGWDFRNFDANMADADVLVFMGLDFNRDRFAERAPRIRWIQLTSAGAEHIMPFDWLPQSVTLTNNSGVHAEKHGEFAFAALLMLNNNVPAMAYNQRQRNWKTVFGTSIRGKTVLIVGVGHIGSNAARRAKGSGMRVLGVRRSGKARRYVDEMFRPEQLPEILPRADFLLVTLPWTQETTAIIGERELKALPVGAGVVNIGRGQTVDYDALASLLESGHLSGAVLDAHYEEPLPTSSRLWTTRNLLISPHCTSSDVEQYAPLTLDLTFENLRRFLDGRPLLNRINKKLGY